MKAILEWGFNIAFAAVIITLCEGVLPSGNIKKFARVGLGLVLVLEMLDPLIKLVQQI
jgi:stage III sporulation protein AF